LDCEEGSEVLVPSYNCGTEVDALIASGFKIMLYRIDRLGEMDIDDLKNRISPKTKIVYVIHYFGFPQPLKKLRELCNERRLYLIEDCALSLFSTSESENIGRTGDISVFSFPKTLPVPDGGVLQLNNPSICTGTWSLGKPSVWPVFLAFLPILKSTLVRAADNVLGPIPPKLFPARLYFPSQSRDGVQDCRKFPDLPSSYYFDDSLANKAISPLTSRLLPSFDPESIRNQRRRNFLAYLHQMNFVPDVVPLFSNLPPGVCPLSFPVLMNQPALMSNELIRHRIEAIPWWSGYHQRLPWENFPDACYLKEHVLALPVHQGIGETEVEYISRCFNDLVVREEFH
jgi:dTDP-4-amino-4,6-dideoxygalactose transaminase